MCPCDVMYHVQHTRKVHVSVCVCERICVQVMAVAMAMGDLGAAELLRLVF